MVLEGFPNGWLNSLCNIWKVENGYNAAAQTLFVERITRDLQKLPFLPPACLLYLCKHAFCFHMYLSLFMAMLIVYFTFWLVMGFVMHLGFLGLADIYEENWGKVTEKLKPSDTRKSINSEESV